MALDANVNVNWLWAGQGDMRPLPATDPLTRRVVELMNELDDEGARVKVLESALLQKTALQNPFVAAQIREAQDEARKKAEVVPPRHRRGISAR